MYACSPVTIYEYYYTMIGGYLMAKYKEVIKILKQVPLQEFREANYDY